MGRIREFGASTQTSGGMAMNARRTAKKKSDFAEAVGRGLRRAARDALKTARMYGTPIYVWENGKVVAKRP